jgi:putative Ca2+/H+ antiporter (TMEM165/GDT1 family)
MSASLTTLSLPSIVGIAYVTILTAELVGDKAIYTISALALRVPTHTIVAGMATAFASKMLVAVSLGELIMRIPSRWIATISAVAFFTSAIAIWSDESSRATEPSAAPAGARRGWITCFFALFIPEWGDPGQVAAAALTLHTHSGLAPWLGGTLALATKGSLALAIGVSLRERLPRAKLRLVASASCCVLGVVAIATVFVH